MAVWCGQCQTRNEGQPDWCSSCGAPLHPAAESLKPTFPATEAAVHSRVSYGPVICDRTRLRRLIAACFPDRSDLMRLSKDCRVAFRTEEGEGGRGLRTYFLPERVIGRVVVESLSARLGAESVSLSIVNDNEDSSQVAIYWMEETPRVQSASLTAKLAQYEQLARDRRAAGAQLCVAPLVSVALVIVLLFLLLPTGLSTPALVPLFLAGAGAIASLGLFHSSRIQELAGQEQALVRLRESLDLGARDVAPLPDSRWLGRHGSLLALSASATLLIWLAVRSLFWSGSLVSSVEAVLVSVVSLSAHPAIVSLQNLSDWLTLRRVRAELAAGDAGSYSMPSWSPPSPSLDVDVEPGQ